MPESGSRKCFHTSGMCAIDSPHKITPIRMLSGQKKKLFDFRVNTPNPFPESGPRKHFHASGMHKSIPRINLPLYWSFLVKKFSRPKNIIRTQKCTFFTHPVLLQQKKYPTIFSRCLMPFPLLPVGMLL